MEIKLHRTYYSNGTNGLLMLDNQLVCYTIELPWRDNEPRVSCIPEGEYPLAKRLSPNHGKCLLLKNVPNRSLILIHPANNAIRELQGCIAPVSKLTGPGCGDRSRMAFNTVLQQVYAALNKQHSLTIQIVKNELK
ncbi:hypothetical protein HNQ91_003647 [Filimonas zeae]|uniref:DUF5675 domain-containing protein n=1 Tax=Filimonas zeae TaxID=1737353 RepID=A0A917MZ33_9BACT|nr:DUF5675 family protein [Filimonas zeae]MDR6340582.1 hypothetical protein [Filimonas zeae]GGH73400.1 hypothetical protein GCM10011379_34880 [Filimonas zeae]